jgi:hypothetical protein
MGASAQSGVWSAPQAFGVAVDFPVLPDSCIPAEVTFKGDLTIEAVTMVDGDGNLHLRSTVPHFNVTATDLAGGQYTLVIVSKVVETISQTGDTTSLDETQIFRAKIIGQGPLPNETAVFMNLRITSPNPNSQSIGVNIDRTYFNKCTGK